MSENNNHNTISTENLVKLANDVMTIFPHLKHINNENALDVKHQLLELLSIADSLQSDLQLIGLKDTEDDGHYFERDNVIEGIIRNIVAMLEFIDLYRDQHFLD